MRTRTFLAAAALAVTATAVAVPATPAGAAIAGTVDIRVEMDLPYCCPGAGPRVFEVTGVTPGPGPELTIADETANPSSWGGALNVDVDPDTLQITVTGDNPAGTSDFELAVVTVTFSDATFSDLTTVSDTLWEDPAMVLSVTPVADGFEIRWDAGVGNPNSINYTDGAGVFQLVEATPFDPTMALAPASVPSGTPATLSGGSCAGGEVTVVMQKATDTPITGQATPDGAGDWTFSIATAGLTGDYTVQAVCVMGATEYDYTPVTLSITAAPTTSTTQPATAPVTPRFTG